MYVIQLIGLVNGLATKFDGEYLKEYDPMRPGKYPDGRDMYFLLVTTPDRSEAKKFDTAVAVHVEWTRSSGRTRPDGKDDRPLTAFTISPERVD